MSREIELKFGSGLYSLKDIVIEYGKGPYLYDIGGKEYLDFTSGHGVAVLGHAHPILAEAICKQASELITLHSSYPTRVRAEFFEKLAEITPAPLKHIFPVNSGTEAVEAALKFALSYSANKKNPNIIAMKRSFHGRTLGALSVTFNPAYRKKFKSVLIPNVRFAAFNNIDSVRENMDENTAAVIVEPVQGEGGVYPAEQSFLEALRELCDEMDVPLIFDEVQCGMGRTGAFWACEKYNVIPDILCTAKGLGGGVPLGATIMTDKIANSLRKGDHASTFGGNPLAMAAGKTVIEIMCREKIVEHVASIGKYIMDRLSVLKEPPYNTTVREIRGLGLMIGIQLRTKAGPYIRKAAEKGVLFLPAGLTVIRMLPPLIIDKKDADVAVDVLLEILRN